MSLRPLAALLLAVAGPEMAQAPDGANVRSYLQSRLRLGSSVTLRPQTVDRFGRPVAEDGMASAYRQYLGLPARTPFRPAFRRQPSRYPRA